MNENKTKFLISTDSLGGYGLDLIFEIAKETGFDGIDLAIWKNFDAWNTDYVKKLSESHNLPIKVIQTSGTINAKELNQAIELCQSTGADTISINAPQIMDFKAYNFLTDNLDTYKKDNPDINFAIINPEDSNLLGMVPKYHFANLVEIIKKYGCYLGLDIVNIDDGSLETEFLKKMQQFIPYMAVVYFSDKSKNGETHMIPGDGVLKLPSFLKKLKQYKYNRNISIKVNISKADLADGDRVRLIFKKIRKYLQENYEEIEIND